MVDMVKIANIIVLIVLLQICIPAISAAIPYSSIIQNSRISISFPSYDKPGGIPQISIPTPSVVIGEITKPVLKQQSPLNSDQTWISMGISLDKLHKNIGLGIQRLSGEPDACWIPINPIGPIRIPMSVAYIDGYYCDKPWIPHIKFPN